MRGRLAQSIYEYFAKEGRKADLNELERGGVKAVTVLGADQLAVLIERALERALEQRMLELSEPDKAKLLDSARLEFNRLRTELDGLEGETQKKRAEVAELERRLSNLQSDFESANASLDAELQVAVAQNGAPQVDAQKEYAVILDVVRQVEMGANHSPEKIARAVANYLADERRRAAEKAAHDQRDRIDQLERRLSKLNEQLERTEADLVEAVENSQREEGVASIYKTVQGLRATVKDFERKKAMLSDIFNKNLVLQKGAAGS